MPPPGGTSKLGRFSQLRSDAGFRRSATKPTLPRSRSSGERKSGGHNNTTNTTTNSSSNNKDKDNKGLERVTRVFGRSQSQKNRPTPATPLTDRKSLRSPSPLRRRGHTPAATTTSTPEHIIDKTKHISIDQLWVPITMQMGHMTITNSSDAICTGCSAAILCNWCSPSWVFRSQKQILQQRKAAINSSIEARTLVLEHRARRKGGNNQKNEKQPPATTPSKYDDEGYIVDELYETVQQQSSLIEDFTADLEETREKMNSLQRCGEGFAVTISELKEELRKSKADCERLRNSISQVQYRHQEQLSSLGCTPQHRGGSAINTPVRFNTSLVSSGTATPTAVNYTSLSPSRGRSQPCHVAIEQCESLTHSLTSDCVCSTYAVADVVSAFQNAKRVALKLESRLEDSLRDKKTLELWNSELVSQTSRAKRRSRSPSPTATTTEFQERLKNVKHKADIESVRIRAACAYQIVSSKAAEVDLTHSELLSSFIDEDSETSMLLHQLEPQEGGQVTKDEWLSWFTAMHNIGQSIDHILDWLVVRTRQMDRPADEVPSQSFATDEMT